MYKACSESCTVQCHGSRVCNLHVHPLPYSLLLLHCLSSFPVLCPLHLPPVPLPLSPLFPGLQPDERAGSSHYSGHQQLHSGQRSEEESRSWRGYSKREM